VASALVRMFGILMSEAAPPPYASFAERTLIAVPMSRVPPRLFELKRLNKSQSRFPETNAAAVRNVIRSAERERKSGIQRAKRR